MKLENVKKIKSTGLGFALIAFSGFLLYEQITTDYWILGGLFISGLLLFFTGDGWINSLQNLLTSYFTKKIEDKKDGE